MSAARLYTDENCIGKIVVVFYQFTSKAMEHHLEFLITDNLLSISVVDSHYTCLKGKGIQILLCIGIAFGGSLLEKGFGVSSVTQHIVTRGAIVV